MAFPRLPDLCLELVLGHLAVARLPIRSLKPRHARAFFYSRRQLLANARHRGLTRRRVAVRRRARYAAEGGGGGFGGLGGGDFGGFGGSLGDNPIPGYAPAAA